jgi:hypothetical protein
MNELNLDPGLRQAFNQQTHQRLIAEANHARMAKSVRTKNPDLSEEKQYSLRAKIKDIGQIIRESGSTIVTILKTSSPSPNA